jgi:hypothetical protein
MNRFPLTCALLLLTLPSAAQQPNPAQKLITATTDFPGFTINVTYSDKAKKLLLDRKESVKAAGYLTGTPKKGALKKYVSEMGEVNLGEIEVEFSPGDSARFSTVKIKSDVFSQTDGANPQININVFSGRKSSPDNLLDCGTYEGALKDLQGKTTTINCKVIGEK